jgi:polysaccharide pyruvyl transferase WcaK-like protein
MAPLRIAHVHFRTRHNVGDAAVVAAIRQLVGARLGAVRWSSLRLRLLQQPPTRKLLERINAHDLVLIGGGGLYSRWGLPLDAAALTGIRPPLIVFGAGFNRNRDDEALTPQQIDSVHQLHARARLASVRDEASRQWLAQLGHEACCTGDPALFLEPSRPLWPRLGRAPRIGLNFAAHGWSGQERFLDPVMRIVVAELAEAARTRGAQLVYLRHADAEERIIPGLRQALPGLRVARCGPRQLAWIYRQLDLVVSMMLHSSILAYAARVPCVNIGYDAKNQAFMADTAQLGRFLPVGGVEGRVLRGALDLALAEGAADAAALALWAARTSSFIAAIAAMAGR